MIVVIDFSESTGRLRVIALVATKEHLLGRIVKLAGWVRHYREIPSRDKRKYLERFPERYRKVLPYLSLSRVCFNIECVNQILSSINPELIIIDDKLAQSSELRLSEHVEVRKESEAVKNKLYRVLVTLADNLANYARIRLLTTKDRDKAMREIRQLEKEGS